MYLGSLILIPSLGGLLGGIFTYLNLKVNKMRSKYINKMKWLRVVEILIIVLAFSFVALYLPSVFPCRLAFLAYYTTY